MLKTLSRSSLLVAGLFSVTLACWGNTLWIKSKAVVAQTLIKRAWEERVQTGIVVKPWSWADTWPVAAMEFPSRDVSLFALAGSHGTSLAFGPGHLDGTALPGDPGAKVFSGHRDTHFRFLEYVQKGEIFRLQSPSGRWQHYRVSDKIIADINRDRWIVDTESDSVQLVTCYPFDSVTVNPRQRLIVTGEPVDPDDLRGEHRHR